MGDLVEWLEYENLLVLATHPGEEVLHCGALIARACARGRPPLVAIMTDGGQDSALAEARAQQARAAAMALGLPEGRLFLLGIHRGTAPQAGSALFAALVSGLHFLMWSRDCGVIVAPAAGDGDAASAAAAARTLADETGVALMRHGTGPARLVAGPAKQAALAAYGLPPMPGEEAYLMPFGHPSC